MVQTNKNESKNKNMNLLFENSTSSMCTNVRTCSVSWQCKALISHRLRIENEHLPRDVSKETDKNEQIGT